MKKRRGVRKTKMKAEEHNLKEEIKEIVEKSLKSGINNESCAVFRILRKENYSPRGKAIMLDNNFYEKIIYRCNLCKACDTPIDNGLCNSFQKARQVLVLQKKEMKANKEMIDNLNKTGNIYGIRD